MKIVPDGQDPKEVAPQLIGTTYASSPLTVTQTGRLYFRNNDNDQGIGDNSGQLSVTVELDSSTTN